MTTESAPSQLIPAAWSRPADDPIFALNAAARRRLAEGAPVINATLGALLDDTGQLACMTTVFEAFDRVPRAKAAAYAPIAGDAEFLAAVIDDAVGTDQRAQAVAVATPGGTGALYQAICNFAAPGDPVLTTAHYWGPYHTLCEQTGRRLRTFATFDAAGRFNVEAMAAGLREVQHEAGRALVLLNSPCHNPTGYSLDASEWRDVTAAIETAAQRGPVTVLLDLAYARFCADDPAAMHAVIERLARHCLVIVAWSASKTYAQYGARVGAAVAIHREDALRKRVHDALSFSCRGTWSNCNHHGLLAVTALLTDDALRARCDAERDTLRALLTRRVDAWNRHAGQAALRYPRYAGGFFVTVFVDDAPAALAARLRERDVFVVPISGALRVGICAVREDQIARLAGEIAAVV